MERGFTLNGQHSSVLGIIMASKTVPILAGSNDAYLQVPGRDGSYLIPRELADVPLPIECGIKTANAIALMTAKRQIAAWVFSRQKVQLIFDDEPDKFYMVKYVGEIGLSKMSSPGMGQFTLIFRCEPTAYSIADTSSGLTTTNPGTAPVFPKFTATFTAAATSFRLLLGSSYVMVVRNFAINDVLVIDNALSKVTLNGINILSSLDLGSRFFSLPAGASTILPSPVGVANVVVSYKGRWL